MRLSPSFIERKEKMRVQPGQAGALFASAGGTTVQVDGRLCKKVHQEGALVVEDCRKAISISEG